MDNMVRNQKDRSGNAHKKLDKFKKFHTVTNEGHGYMEQ